MFKGFSTALLILVGYVQTQTKAFDFVLVVERFRFFHQLYCTLFANVHRCDMMDAEVETSVSCIRTASTKSSKLLATLRE